MLIRRACAADASHAVRIVAGGLAEHGIVFDATGRDADVTSFGTSAEHDDLVADIEGAAVGVVRVGAQGEPGVAWISTLFVARDARGRGIGRALMVAAHDAAHARGCRSIGLRTRAVFRDAIRLYESLGYTRSQASSAGGLEAGGAVYVRALP
jgi:GNAT superfamily N-acetyltransferase